MKKIIITILLVLCVALMPTAMAASKTTTTKTTGTNEPVKVYLFFASWCSHCHDFISYFSDKYADYADKFEIVAFRVDENQVNSDLMRQIESAIGRPEDKSGSIPLIIIGDWFQGGFGSDGSNIIEKAIAAGTDKNYKDVVAETIAKNKLDSDPMEFSEAVKLVLGDNTSTDVTTPTEEQGNDTLIVIVVFAVIVLGFGGLFLYSRKSN